MKQETTIKFIEPMLAHRVRELPVGDWTYEMKLDGYRALAFKVGPEVGWRLGCGLRPGVKH